MSLKLCNDYEGLYMYITMGSSVVDQIKWLNFHHTCPCLFHLPMMVKCQIIYESENDEDEDEENRMKRSQAAPEKAPQGRCAPSTFNIVC